MVFSRGIYSLLQNKNFKHGILYTLFSFFNNGISFILLLILAKFLNPSGYGYLNLFNTFVTLLSIIISLSSVSYISRSFFLKSRDEINHIIFVVLLITTTMLMLCSLVLISLPETTEKIIGIKIEFLWFGLLICYFQIYNNVNLDLWRLEEKPITYGLYGVSYAIGNFILTFLYIVAFKYGWEGRVYAWVIISAIYFIITIIFLIKRKYLIISKPSWNVTKQILFFSLPLIPHSLSYWLKQGCDRFIINYYWDASEVGLFSFAMNFASVINIFGTAFNSSNSVYIYKNLSSDYNNVKYKLKKQTRGMTLIFFIITILIIAVTSLIIPIVLPDYAYCIRYLTPLCIGAFFQCIYLLWVNYLFFYKKTIGLMFITFSTCMFQIIFSLILTKYGVIYTSYLSMVISCVTMTAVIVYAKKILKNEL